MRTMRQRPFPARAKRAIHRATLRLEGLEDRRLMSSALVHSAHGPQLLDDNAQRRLHAAPIDARRSAAISPVANRLAGERDQLVKTASTLGAAVERATATNNGALSSLANSSAVKSLNQDWNKLSQSSTVKTVSSKLQHFGDSLATSLKKLF